MATSSGTSATSATIGTVVGFAYPDGSVQPRESTGLYAVGDLSTDKPHGKEAVMASSEAHQKQMLQYLNSKELRAGFQRVVFELLVAQRRAGIGVGMAGAVR